MAGRDQGIAIRYQPPVGPARRVRYEPRSDGLVDRFEEIWTGCQWRVQGCEPVAEVALESSTHPGREKGEEHV